MLCLTRLLLENVINAFAENLCAGEPEGAEVEGDGDENAQAHAEPGDVHRAGDPPGGCYHSKGEEEEGQDVLQSVTPAEANEMAGAGLPHEEPGDVQHDVEDDHHG